MVKQLLKLILSLILISSIFCSFGLGEAISFNVQSDHQQDEISIDLQQDSFSCAIVGNHSNPLVPYFTSFPAEECEPEEECAKKKYGTLHGYYFNRVQLTDHVNAPSLRFAPLSNYCLYHPSLYLLFEVFIL